MVQAAFEKKHRCPQHSGPLTMEPQLSDIALSRVTGVKGACAESCLKTIRIQYGPDFSSVGMRPVAQVAVVVVLLCLGEMDLEVGSAAVPETSVV